MAVFCNVTVVDVPLNWCCFESGKLNPDAKPFNPKGSSSGGFAAPVISSGLGVGIAGPAAGVHIAPPALALPMYQGGGGAYMAPLSQVP